MSVAFRRESDDEHKEPRFELPLPPGPNLVTARGRQLIEAKVAELETTITAAEGEAVEALRRELRYWVTRMTTAEIAPPPDDDEAGIGSRIRIRLAGRDRVIDIVGADEADPASDRIGYAAPLAHALLGATPGERVDFNGKAEAIEVIAVSPIPEETV
ncbi:nucleoside-diphosphate kinase [Sphingomonas koreensis]|nr:nucleoside-diphosphate kinase [Sphingomonas koreensis]